MPIDALPSLFAAAFLGGIVCLTRFAVVVCGQNAPRFTTTRFQRVVLAGGAACALSTFLLLPVGALPAWLPCNAPLPGWFVAFCLACAALAWPPRPRGFIARLFAVPTLLAACYALCAWHACRHGLPGSLWQLERFVALPLLTHADGLTRLSALCLALASILACAAALPVARRAAPFLAITLQLAAAQYLVCLFVPLAALATTGVSPLIALITSALACWGCMGLLLFICHRLGPRVPVWLPWLLAGASLACLLER